MITLFTAEPTHQQTCRNRQELEGYIVRPSTYTVEAAGLVLSGDDYQPQTEASKSG